MTLVISILLAGAAIGVLLLFVVGVVRGDGNVTVWGKPRQRPTATLPRSHYRDMFEPRPLA